MTEIKKQKLQKIFFKQKYLDKYLHFRYISFSDLRRASKTIKKPPKEFSLNFLINQIQNLDIFQKKDLIYFIDKNLISLINQYSKEGTFLEKYYKKSKLKKKESKFKDSFKIYFDEQLKSLGISTSLIEKQISEIIRPLLPQFSFLQGIAKMYSSILEPFYKNFEDLGKIISQAKINDKECLKKLKKYSWIITPEMPLNIINAIPNLKNSKEMKELFELYYFSNDFEELDNCLKRFEDNELFKKRMKIFRDSFAVIKLLYQDKKININTVIIPVLINQIEGIKQDYLSIQKNLPKNRNIFYEANGNEKPIKKIFDGLASKQNDDIMGWGFKFFIDILFQQDGDKMKIINFSRHKISHGKIVLYGRKETLIRTILMLDFLSQITQ